MTTLTDDDVRLIHRIAITIGDRVLANLCTMVLDHDVRPFIRRAARETIARTPVPESLIAIIGIRVERSDDREVN